MKVKILQDTQDKLSLLIVPKGAVLDSATIIDGGYEGMLYEDFPVQVIDRDAAVIVED